jgi:hypothetical protein
MAHRAFSKKDNYIGIHSHGATETLEVVGTTT